MKKSRKTIKIEVIETDSTNFNDGQWKNLSIKMLVIDPELSKLIYQILYRTSKWFIFDDSGLFDRFEIDNLKSGHYNFVRAELEKLVSNGEIIFNKGD